MNWIAVVALALALAACTPRFEWRELRSADGYTVVLPGRAQVVTREVALVSGTRVPMTMSSSGAGATLFAVGVARLPSPVAGDAQARAELVGAFRDALIRNVQGKLIARSDAPRLPLPPGAGPIRVAESVEATAIVGSGRPGRLAARFYVVDDRLFQLVALGADGELPAEALETFFTSFRVN